MAEQQLSHHTHAPTSWHFAWWVDDSHSARVAKIKDGAMLKPYH
jgi:hypothetical protein